MKKLISLSFFIIISYNLFAQVGNVGIYVNMGLDTTFSEYSTYNNYQKDLYILRWILKNTHPNIYNTFSKNEMDSQFVRSMKYLAKNTNDIQFYKEIRRYTAMIYDGHTTAYFSIKNSKMYPVRFTFIDSSIYIEGVSKFFYAKKRYLIGSKVLSINGIPVNVLITKLFNYFYGNDVARRRKIVKNLNYAKYYQFLDIDNSMIIIKSQNNSIYYTDTFYLQNKRIEPSEYLPKKYYSNKLFYYKIIDDSICYFKYNECADIQTLNYFGKEEYSRVFLFLAKIVWHLRGGDFKIFLKKMFSEIDKKHINHLIVDISNNSGGSSILGDQFLYYLGNNSTIKGYSQKDKLSPFMKYYSPDYYKMRIMDYHIKDNQIPYLLTLKNDTNYFEWVNDKSSYFYLPNPKRYTGSLYLIIGQKTFSSAAMLATMMKDNNLANLIVGDYMTISPSHFGETVFFDLPYTGAWGHCSTKQFIRPDSTNTENNIFPDVRIFNSVEDNLTGDNKSLEYLLNYIEKR